MTSETRTFAEAAALLPDDFYLKGAKHFLKAVRKHPRFADALWRYDILGGGEARFAAVRNLVLLREYIGRCDGDGILSAAQLLECEMEEARIAGAFDNDAAACVDELYDAVAVLVRMIAVVEGKQKLGGEK